jgi:23S rRNA (adenine2503-C2)-methyltransferase
MAPPSERARPDSLYDLDAEALGRLCADQPAYRAGQVRDGLYRRLLLPHELTDVPKALRGRIAEEAPLALEAVEERHADRGETVKWLWRLADGALVESVLMHYPGRSTVCVSTQAGCAMACGFCATGQAGFRRHLSAGEIVEQVVHAARHAQRAPGGPRRVGNVVFMGMGEPLANFERVWAAVHRLHDDLGLSARHLTLSTVGLVPGIRRLAREDLPVNLAVSLHAANDRLRDRLVPVNRRYPLRDLMAACAEYLAAKGRRLTFEWALIAGVNDRPEDAEELARLVRPLRAHVNLIPLNPTPGWPTKGTDARGVAAFAARLHELGAQATVRRNRGTDIDAACGQLAGAAGPGTAGGDAAAPVALRPRR